MIIWYAMIIPLLAVGVLYLFFKHKTHVYEILGLISIPAIVILIFYSIASNYDIQDTQFKSELITRIRYYESWETWKHRTCSYTTCSGSGKTRICTTHYYDCSYCDYNKEHYTAVTISGKEFSLTREKYQELLNRWKAKPKFVELNRSIKYHGGCGKDGDMYESSWNFDKFTTESATIETSYDNRTQVALSAFNYPKISKENADSLGLFSYPEIDGYIQPNIGFNSYWWKNKSDKRFNLYQHLNGFIGPNYKAHVFLLFFKNKDVDIAFKQEAYWANGNQNEVVICIGYSGNKINWVRPFSWSENKRTLVDLREDISELKTIDLNKMYPLILNSIKLNYHYRDLDKDFEYLSVDLTEHELIVAYLLILVLTFTLCYYFVTNDFEHEK